MSRWALCFLDWRREVGGTTPGDVIGLASGDGPAELQLRPRGGGTLETRLWDLEG